MRAVRGCARLWRRRIRGRLLGVLLGQALRFDSAPTRDIGLVLRQRRCKGMTTGTVGDEIERV